MRITDDTQIRALISGREAWTGTVAELEERNCFDRDECAGLRAALHAEGVYVDPKGSRVELLSFPWTLIVLAAPRGYSVIRSVNAVPIIKAAVLLAKRGSHVTLLNEAGESVNVLAFVESAAHIANVTLAEVG